MLNRKQKKELVENIAQKIGESLSIVICDYKGLKVSEIRELRRQLKSQGANFKVIKKNLLQLALKRAEKELQVKNLEGQIALIYGGQDEIFLPKTAYQFSLKHEQLKILKGLFGGDDLAAEELVELAKLPGREELLARLVGSIGAPINGFVRVLKGNLRGLVCVLNSIKEAKS